MKAISLWNPWATLLASGAKKCETRSWRLNHRGPLLVHAGKKWDPEFSSLCVREPFKTALECMGIFHDNPFTKPHGLHFGAIIGRVNVLHCYATEDAKSYPAGLIDVGSFGDAGGLRITETERAFGDYSPGRFAFLCANPVLFAKPIPFAGALGLFDVPDHLLPAG